MEGRINEEGVVSGNIVSFSFSVQVLGFPTEETWPGVSKLLPSKPGRISLAASSGYTGSRNEI